MRSRTLALVLALSACSKVDDAPAKTTAALRPGAQHLLATLDVDRGVARVVDARTVDAPLPTLRVAEARAWRVVVEDRAGLTLYETSMAAADTVTDPTFRRPRYGVSLRLPLVAAARVRIFEGAQVVTSFAWPELNR